jgi:hypothetical protein
MMSGNPSREALLERLLPITGTPHRRPAGVHRHYRKPSIGRHLYQACTKLPDWDAGDCATELPAAPPSPHSLTADLARIGEV